MRVPNVNDGKLMWQFQVTTVPQVTDVPPLTHLFPSLVLQPSCSKVPSVSTLSCYCVLRLCNLWWNTLPLLPK